MCLVSGGTDGTQHETATVWERNAAEQQPNAMDAREAFPAVHQRSAEKFQGDAGKNRKRQ